MLRSNLNLPEAIKADLVFVISGVLGFSWSHTLNQLSKQLLLMVWTSLIRDLLLLNARNVKMIQSITMNNINNINNINHPIPPFPTFRSSIRRMVATAFSSMLGSAWRLRCYYVTHHKLGLQTQLLRYIYHQLYRMSLMISTNLANYHKSTLNP